MKDEILKENQICISSLKDTKKGLEQIENKFYNLQNKILKKYLKERKKVKALIRHEQNKILEDTKIIYQFV